jgi:hypothetical protein
MAQVLIKEFALNGVVLGTNLPCRLFGMDVYYVRRVFPFVAKFHVIFTAPMDYFDCYIRLRKVHEAQQLITLTFTMDDGQVFRFPGYLILCHFAWPQSEDSAGREIELELVRPPGLSEPWSYPVRPQKS